MYSWDNIVEILDFRNLSTGWNDNGADRPSDELIIEALDLVRKFRKVPTPKVYANVVGIDTVIKFHWDVKEFGFIECTLSEDYLKLFVLDDNSNILVNDVEIDNVEYNSIDFIIEYFWRVVSGEIKNIWKERLKD